jgi:hypothetical protein
MFFNIADFYRPCKRIIRVRGKETETDSPEIVPFDELTWKQRMCIDGILYRGPQDIPIYQLPNREKAHKSSPDLMRRVYQNLIRNFREDYAKFFALVCDSAPASLLFHCSIGKDRTGFPGLHSTGIFCTLAV